MYFNLNTNSHTYTYSGRNRIKTPNTFRERYKVSSSQKQTEKSIESITKIYNEHIFGNYISFSALISEKETSPKTEIQLQALSLSHWLERTRCSQQQSKHHYYRSIRRKKRNWIHYARARLKGTKNVTIFGMLQFRWDNEKPLRTRRVRVI